MTDSTLASAVDLLYRFFREEGFATPAASIWENARRLAADPHHWLGIAWADGKAAGVVTVTTALYIEWGRLGEIGDLYVLPQMRRRGIATALIEAAKTRCAGLGCSAVSVVTTPAGQARHGLDRFYGRFGFVSEGRRVLTSPLR